MKKLKMAVSALLLAAIAVPSTTFGSDNWDYTTGKYYVPTGSEIIYQDPSNDRKAQEHGYESADDLKLPITREEVCALVYYYIQIGDYRFSHERNILNKNGKADFTDFNTFDPVLQDMVKMLNLDLGNILGCLKDENDNLNPNSYVTRAEGAGVTSSYLNYFSSLPLGKYPVKKFSDVPAHSKFDASISHLTEYNIVSGSGNNKFRPDDLSTRNEFIDMFINVAKVEQENGSKTSMQDDVISAARKVFKISLVPLDSGVKFIDPETKEQEWLFLNGTPNKLINFQVPMGEEQLYLYRKYPLNATIDDTSFEMVDKSIAEIVPSVEKIPEDLASRGYGFVTIKGNSIGKTSIKGKSALASSESVVEVTSKENFEWKFYILDNTRVLYKNEPMRIWILRYPFDTFDQSNFTVDSLNDNIIVEKDEQGFTITAVKDGKGEIYVNGEYNGFGLNASYNYDIK